jgi:hypothetical protein
VKQEESAATSLHHYQFEADNKKGAAGSALACLLKKT